MAVFAVEVVEELAGEHDPTLDRDIAVDDVNREFDVVRVVAVPVGLAAVDRQGAAVPLHEGRCALRFLSVGHHPDGVFALREVSADLLELGFVSVGPVAPGSLEGKINAHLVGEGQFVPVEHDEAECPALGYAVALTGR